MSETVQPTTSTDPSLTVGNNTVVPYEDQVIPVLNLEAYSGEGTSFETAKFREYSDGTVFTIWDQPGQTVELAPVPREVTNSGWCTVESDYGVMMPDIFNVNDGDQESVTAIETGAGKLLLLQDGYLHAFDGKELIRKIKMDEYFTSEHPTIGGTWVIPRRDGGRPIRIQDIRSIGVEATTRLSTAGDNGFRHFPAFNSRELIAGKSVVKELSRALPQHQ